MKKLLFASISACVLAISCSKSDDPAPVSSEKYMSITAGSSWNYQFTDNINAANNNTYTLSSTTRDTTAAGKSYHVFTNSNGGNEYYNITGGDYYRLQAFNLGGADTTLENLYLKDAVAVNTSWVQNYNIDVAGQAVQVVITNTITESGISKTVGTTTYNNVIHVVTSIASPTLAGVPGSSLSTNIHYYYAPKYGMIQNDTKIDLSVPLLTIDQHNDSKTTLQSATIL